MAKLKHNDPCHCGSGKRYRSCHLRADRETAAREPSAPSPTAVPQGAPARPSWLRVVPVFVGVLGVAAAGWVGMTFDPARGGGVLLLTGLTVAALYVFGDPPPPKEGTSDPAAINFGR